MCNCKYHEDQRRWERLLAKVPMSIGDKRFVENYFNKKATEELDADVNQAVLSGDWPSSVEQLRAALRKAVKKRRDNKKIGK